MPKPDERRQGASINREQSKSKVNKKSVLEKHAAIKKKKSKSYMNRKIKKKLWHINQQKASEAAMSAASVAGK